MERRICLWVLAGAMAIAALMSAPAFGAFYAYSPNGGASGSPGVPALQKFVTGLPGLGAGDNANNLGQYIPVAIPDTTTFRGQITMKSA